MNIIKKWCLIAYYSVFPYRFPMTEEAKQKLDKHLEEWGKRLIAKAHEFAKAENHPDVITGRNIRQAYRVIL